MKRKLVAAILAFIGAVHRIAAELDGQSLVVAGALSSDPETARSSAAAWGLARGYDTYAEMAQAEAARSDGIEFVIVATPNHLHLPVASAFLRHGIHVICDNARFVASIPGFLPVPEEPTTPVQVVIGCVHD